MFNKSKYIALSSISLIILSACNTNRISTLQPIQDSSVITQQSVEKNGIRTAKDSLWIAENAAQRWDMSAELVKVEGLGGVEENGYSNWVYYFKSPFNPRVLRVDNWGSAHEVPNSFFGNEISSFDWRVDSDQAIAIAKTQGLKNFPVIQMTLEQKFATTEWELRTYNGIFRIDADSKKLISKTLK